MIESDLVVDASPVLAVLRGEPFTKFDPYRIEGAWISAANLTEVLTRLILENAPDHAANQMVDHLRLRVIAFDETLARAAARLAPLTRRFGLSLGDRACLATALSLSAAVVTADRLWANLDIGATIILIR